MYTFNSGAGSAVGEIFEVILELLVRGVIKILFHSTGCNTECEGQVSIWVVTVCVTILALVMYSLVNGTIQRRKRGK